MSELLEQIWEDERSNYAPEYDTFSYHPYGEFTDYDHFTVPEIDYAAWVLRKESQEFEKRFPAFACCILKKESEDVRSFSLNFGTLEKWYYTFWYGFYEHERVISHNFIPNRMPQRYKPHVYDVPEDIRDIVTAFIEWVESRNENRLLVLTG